jgi:hypothetical protein
MIVTATVYNSLHSCTTDFQNVVVIRIQIRSDVFIFDTEMSFLFYFSAAEMVIVRSHKLIKEDGNKNSIAVMKKPYGYILHGQTISL